MIAEFHFDSGTMKVDLDRCIDLSDPFSDQGNGVKAWGVDHPRFSIVRREGFVGSIEEGGPVNFRELFFNPHGNGTHTECLGHITETIHSIDRRLQRTFHRALLLNISPAILEEDEAIGEKGDAIIRPGQLVAELQGDERITALIVKTEPYPDGRPRNFSGSNPPYFHPDAMKMLRKYGIFHLLTDLPSVDKENDGGKLLAHHAFWNVPEAPDLERTISELIHVPDGTAEGHYMLDLQIAPVQNDAAPSRPLLFPEA